jgi:ABC-type antimicrobial peptide transport system permease subunit
VRKESQGASGSWARADRRARWRSLAVIAVVAGVTAGLAFASLAGARRTNTAFERLREQTRGADAAVFASQVGELHPDWSKLAARPEVATLAPWYLLFGTSPGESEETVMFGAVDGNWLHTVDRPILRAGRMFDPRADDEMVIDEDTAKQEHASIGDVVDVHAYGARQDDTSGEPPTGAQLHLRVVGIVRSTQQFLFTPMVFLSPGVLAQHRDNMLWIENAFVRLRPGAGGVGALQRDANKLIASGTPILDLRAVQRRVNTTLNVEQSALVLLALAVFAAGLVLVGQMLARSAATIRTDAPVLRAIGMTRRELATAGAKAHGFVAIGSGIAAVITAIIASRWFPVGLAGRVDPDRGMHADWLVIGIGALMVALLVLGFAYLVAARAVRVERARATGVRGSALTFLRHNTPVTIGVGATMAFDQRRNRVDAVRPALIGAIVGVLGVVGALTIDHGLRDALSHPERAGVTWDATVLPSAGDRAARGTAPGIVARVAAVKGVRGVADVDRLVIDVNGVGVPGFTIRQNADEAAPVSFTVVAGHAPTRAGEAAIGPATAKALHVGIGDTVTVGPNHQRARITGRALFPTDVHAAFDEGVWLSAAAWDAAVPPNELSNNLDAFHADNVLAVRFGPGVDSDAGAARLAAALGDHVEQVEPAEVPLELTNLRNVRRLPEVLAAFLALLAIAALTYMLVAISRSRARDFAVLRAIGFTRGQSRIVVGAQSTAISVIGLLIGIPLGVLLGRVAWRLIAERVPLQDVPPVAAVALIAIVPLALVVANLLALWPSQRVARLRVAEVLRAE